MRRVMIDIPDLHCYDGNLQIKEEGGCFFWAMDGYYGCDWKPIPEYLFNALLRYAKEETQ